MVLRSHLGPASRQGWKPAGPRRGSGAVAERGEKPGARQRTLSFAWRDNMLAFDGETLNEAIAQVQN